MTKKFVGSSPIAVARFLTHCVHLNKTKIGEFLGDKYLFPLLHCVALIHMLTHFHVQFPIRKSDTQGCGGKDGFHCVRL